MYLSRIELDIQRNTTKRAISSPQVMHASIESCFQTSEDKNQRSFGGWTD